MLVVILCPALAAEPSKGSLCIAPIQEKASPVSAPGLNCDSEKLSFKIDSMADRPWPTRESVRIDDLGLGERHRVVVLCGGKPQQSFRFRFSEYKGPKLCLFINDLYKTAQLWEDKDCPWCKCNWK